MTSAKGLPPLPLAELQKTMSLDLDLFICSASFESRSLSAPKSLMPEKVKKVFMMRNENVQGKGVEYGEQILAHFRKRAEMVLVSKTSPIKTADGLLAAISSMELGDNASCLVDITTMTHEALLILFRILNKQLPKSVDLKFVYSAAKEYDPGKADENKWLSQGLGEVRSVLGYPGEMRPSRKSHLIVLVGFEEERARKLIETYEPAALSLGIGELPPVNESHLRVNRSHFKRLLSSNPNSIEFHFSPTDPLAVRDIVLEKVKLFEGFNVVIAPMNNKISTLGVALAAIENPEVQICYGRAMAYNVDNYSTPADYCYVFSLPSVI